MKMALSLPRCPFKKAYARLDVKLDKKYRRSRSFFNANSGLNTYENVSFKFNPFNLSDFYGKINPIFTRKWHFGYFTYSNRANFSHKNTHFKRVKLETHVNEKIDLFAIF